MNHAMNSEVSTQSTRIEVDGGLIHHGEIPKYRMTETDPRFLIHDNNEALPNGDKRGEKSSLRSTSRRSKRGSPGRNHPSNELGLFTKPKGRAEKSDQVYASNQTTEAILAEIFGEKAQADQQEQKPFDRKGYCNDEIIGKCERKINSKQSTSRSESFLYNHRKKSSSDVEIKSGYDKHLRRDYHVSSFDVNSNTLMRSFNGSAVKVSRQMASMNHSSDLLHEPLVQSNVVDYYDKLRRQAKGEFMKEMISDVPGRMSPRKGLRSKSSEMPLRKDVHASRSSYSLSKSWGSTRSREEFHSLSKNEGMDKEQTIDLVQKKKIKQMFQMEEKIAIKKAREFAELKLLKKVFVAWQMRAQVLNINADKLCRVHLLRKGLKGLVYAVEYQRLAVNGFVQKRKKVVLVKYWQIWQRQTREIQRNKMQETFTQWHYYKLHVERTKLLKSIANRHFLSKNYSKWKNRFNAKQKNSLASVHFKINLIYKYWNCWAVYTKERRVKNHLNSIARYHYGEKIQHHLFHYWKYITQKSLLCRRLTRRRVLFKALLHWKHWTQYAKIVHLRLQNMCKEYHKKTLTKRMFRKWRQAQRMKITLEFCRKRQLRRAIKLWNLRYMRKRIHKQLCKALARKTRKRRFFEQWICFVKQRKETRAVFLRKMKNFHVRTLFKCWRDETTRTVLMRKLLQEFQRDRASRIVHQQWESWKFQLKIVAMEKCSKNNWTLRCVRKYCEVWKIKVKKVKLETKLHQSCSVFEILFVRRYFNLWQRKLQKERDDKERSHSAARILQKNSLCRILQAWRVVNQEECIIEPLLKRRQRKDMARVFDAWRRFVLRRIHLSRLQDAKNNRLTKNAWKTWSVKLWYITRGKEVEETLRLLKLARHFHAWLEYIIDLRKSERMAKERKESKMRKVIETWKKNAEKKAALREEESSQEFRRHIILRCFFTSWKRKATEHAQAMASVVRTADSTRERILMKRSFLRWQRQYTVEVTTREYVKLKQDEKLRTVFLAWNDFVRAELERQVYDFATNLVMDSSQGSAFLSTSGYQTSLKNSSSSLQFLAADEIFSPVPTPRSRPVTPTLNQDDILPSYRLASIYRQCSFPGTQNLLVSERPPSRCASPLTRQRSLEQLSQAGTSPQRSSEDDGVPSSGIHSAGDESDQDDRTSVHITESLYSYQTTSDSVVRDRELLVAETIIHWRSLSLSVAFRSWYKYTQRMILVRMTYAEWMVRDRERLVTKYLGKWRRWLFVSVLARQHSVNQIKKKFIFKWSNFRKQQILSGQYENEADEFMQRNLLKKFYKIWKRKRTAKSQLQNIVMRWQKTAKVTDMDRQVIEQYKKIDRVNCVRRTFCYWKNATHLSQQATQMSKILSLRRCLLTWRDIACLRAELRKKMKRFREKRVLAKAFKEWLLRYEDVRTAKIIIGVSKERKTDKIFKAWRAWALAKSYRRKTSLLYCRSQQQRRLKAMLGFWFDAAKKCIDMREYYHRSLQRRVLQSWRAVLIHKANTSGTIQEFQSILLRNTLRSTFMFWRKRTKDNQMMLEYSKLKKKRRLALAFNRWKQEKRRRDAEKHFYQLLKKKTFTCWCAQISKRKKARQHFKFWQTKAEGSKELNQVADMLVHDSENKLLKMKFRFWRSLTQHSQVAKYHHEMKMMRRYFQSWYDHCHKEKRLSNQLKQFQQSHQRSNSGLVTKYMKIWLMKSTFSMKAENLHSLRLHSRYWKLWRHNFVRRRVSSAMVDHDNQKILSKVFISWFKITTSHKSLSNEIKTFILRRWFRKWMARYNNS